MIWSLKQLLTLFSKHWTRVTNANKKGFPMRFANKWKARENTSGNHMKHKMHCKQCLAAKPHYSFSGFPSGDSSTDSDSDDENTPRETIAEIIQRLQKSSSQPIPDSILRDSTNANMAEWQPYCQVTLKHTKEVAGYNTISEAFYKLDFCNAIRDIRRFNYISKLLHLLITQNLTSLSGCATKVLFTMLEQLAWQGETSGAHLQATTTSSPF